MSLITRWEVLADSFPFRVLEDAEEAFVMRGPADIELLARILRTVSSIALLSFCLYIYINVHMYVYICRFYLRCLCQGE